MIAGVGISLVAMPAVAQKYVPENGSGNLVQGPGGPPVTPDTPPTSASGMEMRKTIVTPMGASW
jgi:hypothetical protein